MKKTFNKIKTLLATLGVAVVSFISKVLGETFFGDFSEEPRAQALYVAPYTPSSPELPTYIDVAAKLAKRPLIAIAFMVGIISFIKIRKIEDKVQKKKKIKRIIIAISILVILIVACFVLPLLLKKY